MRGPRVVTTALWPWSDEQQKDFSMNKPVLKQGSPIVRDYICAASKYFDLPINDLTGKSKQRDLVKMRHTAMMAAFRIERRPTTSDIARAFSCDYATAHVALKAFEFTAQQTLDIHAIQNMAEDVYQKRMNKAGIYYAS